MQVHSEKNEGLQSFIRLIPKQINTRIYGESPWINEYDLHQEQSLGIMEFVL